MAHVKCKICENIVYRKPSDLERYSNVFCSPLCRSQGVTKTKSCFSCGHIYESKNKDSKFCSRSCANKIRIGSRYTKNRLNHSQSRIHELKMNFKFESCMVENCFYNVTFDVHRLIPGKLGGKYEIGNMFAICPNHHAEVTRNIICLEKINNYTLKIVEK